MEAAPPTSTALVEVLSEGRSRGYLGPGPVEDHITHARGFADHASRPGRVLDLGSGGGIPGFVLAVECWPDATWVLLEAGARRAQFLQHGVDVLGLADRVAVVRGRAEEAARAPEHRGKFDLVVARGFARPGVTAECAAPFLRPEGALVVSDPPSGAGDRWFPAGLAVLGLVMDPVQPTRSSGAHFVRLRQATPCPDRFPRRTGVPAKRPLF